MTAHPDVRQTFKDLCEPVQSDHHGDQRQSALEIGCAVSEPRRGVDRIKAYAPQDEAHRRGNETFHRIAFGKVGCDKNTEDSEPEHFPGTEHHGQFDKERHAHKKQDDAEVVAHEARKDIDPQSDLRFSFFCELVSFNGRRNGGGRSRDVEHGGRDTAPVGSSHLHG